MMTKDELVNRIKEQREQMLIVRIQTALLEHKETDKESKVILCKLIEIFDLQLEQYDERFKGVLNND